MLKNSKELLAIAIKEAGSTQADVAKNMGWTPNKLNLKLGRNMLRADDFIEMLDSLGIEISLTMKGNGRKIRVDLPEIGEDARSMVDGVIYDTKKASLIASDLCANENNKYTNGIATELYCDRSDRYFFVEYYEDEEKPPHIIPISKNIASVFIEKYGA